MATVAGLALVAACNAPKEPLEVTMQEYRTDLLLGSRTNPKEADSEEPGLGASPSLAPIPAFPALPSAFAPILAGVDAFETSDLPGPPLPRVRNIETAECPTADPDARPERLAGDTVTAAPQPATYRYRTQGRYDLGGPVAHMEVPPQPHLAIGKPATEISSGFGGRPENAVDGNTDGRWASGSVTHTFQHVQPWWQVDLLESYQLEKVVIWDHSHAECCANQLGDYYLLVSDEPFASVDEPSLDEVLAQPGVSAYYQADIAQSAIFDVGRTGRYVRVQFAGSDPRYLSLAEVQVYDAATAKPPKANFIRRTGDLPASSKREVMAVTADDPVDGASSFQVRSKRGDITTVNRFMVVHSRPPDGELAPGIYIRNITAESPDGTFSFSVEPRVKLVSFPIERGNSVTSTFTDPLTDTQLSFRAVVGARTTVDACGMPLEAWPVTLRNGRIVGPNVDLAFTARYHFAPQYGGISLRDEVSQAGTAGGAKIDSRYVTIFGLTAADSEPKPCRDCE